MGKLKSRDTVPFRINLGTIRPASIFVQKDHNQCTILTGMSGMKNCYMGSRPENAQTNGLVQILLHQCLCFSRGGKIYVERSDPGPEFWEICVYAENLPVQIWKVTFSAIWAVLEHLYSEMAAEPPFQRGLLHMLTLHQIPLHMSNCFHHGVKRYLFRFTDYWLLTATFL